MPIYILQIIKSPSLKNCPEIEIHTARLHWCRFPQNRETKISKGTSTRRKLKQFRRTSAKWRIQQGEAAWELFQNDKNRANESVQSVFPLVLGNGTPVTTFSVGKCAIGDRDYHPLQMGIDITVKCKQGWSKIFN